MKTQINKTTKTTQEEDITPTSITALPDLIKACKAIKESRCDEEFQDASKLCETAYKKATRK